MRKLGEDARKKQPGDALMGFGVVALVLALFGAANATTAGSPLIVASIGAVLLVLGYLRRRSALR